MSLAKRVIPIMLVKGQTLVKGTQFNPWRSIGHPVQAARVHARRGVDELMIMDVSATAEGRGPDLDLVRQLSEDCYVPITVGGGVKTLADIDALLRAGADKVAIGAALLDTGLVESAADRFGSQAIVAVVNVKSAADGVFTADLAEDKGAGEILLQCIDRDGMMQGYDLELIRAVTAAVSVPVIASCGAGEPKHMLEAIQAGADAVAAGAMFAFTEFTPRGVAKFLHENGIGVRLS